MHGFEHIIAASDLSDCAANALEYAKSIALRFDSRLTVLHAGLFGPRYASMPSSALAISDAWAAQHEAARIALDERHSLQLQNVPKTDRLVVSGRPAESILACASTVGAGLITVGTFGRTGIRRAVLGSVAETVIRDSVAPVLTVPCNKNSPRPKFDRVLLAAHSARLARDVFEHAATIASSFDAELVVLGVGPVADAIEDFEIHRLREWMGDVRVPIRTKIVMHRGDAAEQILWQARQESADVLVVGLRQVANPTILAASVKTLVRHSSCPVMTVPLSRSQFSRI